MDAGRKKGGWHIILHTACLPTSLEETWRGTSQGLPQHCVHDGSLCKQNLATSVLRCHLVCVPSFDRRGTYTVFFVTLSPDSIKVGSSHRGKCRKTDGMDLDALFIMQVPPFKAVHQDMMPNVDELSSNVAEATTFAETEAWEHKRCGVYRKEVCRSRSKLHHCLRRRADRSPCIPPSPVRRNILRFFCGTRCYHRLSFTCQWTPNIVPVTVLPSSMIKQSNFENLPFSMPGRAARTWVAQRAWTA